MRWHAGEGPQGSSFELQNALHRAKQLIRAAEDTGSS